MKEIINDNQCTNNYFAELNAKITSTEFEKLCIDFFEKINTHSASTIIKHDKLYVADDGTYQLDGYIEHTDFNVKYKTIIECKLFDKKNKVKRDYAMLLNQKIQSTGANKGILISTSGFQSGAITFAKKHGIALLQIVDGNIRTIQASLSSPISQHNIPKHEILMYDLDMGFPMYPLNEDYSQLNNFLYP